MAVALRPIHLDVLKQIPPTGLRVLSEWLSEHTGVTEKDLQSLSQRVASREHPESKLREILVWIAEQEGRAVPSPIGIEAEFEPESGFYSSSLILEKGDASPAKLSTHMRNEGLAAKRRKLPFIREYRAIPGVLPSEAFRKSALDFGLRVDPIVEFGNSERDWQFLEMHFRSQGDAGDLGRGITAHLESLGIRNPVLHFHLIGKGLRPKDLPHHPDPQTRAENQLMKVTFIEFIRRLEIVAQMGVLIFGRNPIVSIHAGKEKLAGALPHDEYGSLITNIRNDTLSTVRATGLWGWNLARVYDPKDLDLLSGEYRGELHGHPEWFARLMTAAQNGIVYGETGLDKNLLLDWIAQRSAQNNREEVRRHFERSGYLPEYTFGTSLVDLYPHIADRISMEDAPYILPKGVSSHPRLEKILAKMNRKMPDPNFKIVSHETALLVHAWENDILFYNKPTLLKKILAAQMKGLDRIAAGEEPVGVVAEFLDESGIFEGFQRSLSMVP